jgi:hypothetical protein
MTGEEKNHDDNRREEEDERICIHKQVREVFFFKWSHMCTSSFIILLSIIFNL